MFHSNCGTAFTLFCLLSSATSFCPFGQWIVHPSSTTTTKTGWNLAHRSEQQTTSPCLYSTSEDISDSTLGTSVRFLGRGKNAIVRPGCILIAPPDEFHHFLREAAVFIYAMGEDEYDTFVIRGAIIDHPTPFTIQEMMAGDVDGNAKTGSSNTQPEYLQNLLYRGGELGDAAFMLHSDTTLGEQANLEMIGTSGVFEGGLEHAMSTNYSIDPQKAKFFFSYMEFTEAELEEMLENRESDTTQWVSVEVPPDFVLSSEWERGEAWARLRNAVRDM